MDEQTFGRCPDKEDTQTMARKSTGNAPQETRTAGLGVVKAVRTIFEEKNG
jgi:hypothetical protein